MVSLCSNPVTLPEFHEFSCSGNHVITNVFLIAVLLYLCLAFYDYNKHSTLVIRLCWTGMPDNQCDPTKSHIIPMVKYLPEAQNAFCILKLTVLINYAIFTLKGGVWSMVVFWFWALHSCRSAKRQTAENPVSPYIAYDTVTTLQSWGWCSYSV